MNADGTNKRFITDANNSNAQPCWSPVADKIAFISDRDGHREVYLMKSDGTGQTQLTDDGKAKGWLAFSPDGKVLSFSQNEKELPNGWWIRSLNTFDLETGEIRKLHTSRQGGGFSSWARNGAVIYFYEISANGLNDIYSIKVRVTCHLSFLCQRCFHGRRSLRHAVVLQLARCSSSLSHRRREELCVNDFSPNWSPDGSRIAFASQRAVTGAFDNAAEIYTINPDGSDEIRLTDNEFSDTGPSWSPDGSRLAFVSDRDGKGEVYIMDENGSNLKNLTRHPAHDFNPTWSPDGTRLAFQSYRDGQGQVYIMNTDGSGQENISRNKYGETNPDWSPDGSQIVHVSDRNGRRGIYLMNADGSDQRKLSGNKFMDLLNPKWASDGAKIVFHSFFEDFGTERGAIHVMNADGSNVRKLTGDDLYHFNPFFSPDNGHISFNVADEEVINISVISVDGTDRIDVTKRSPELRQIRFQNTQK